MTMMKKMKKKTEWPNVDDDADDDDVRYTGVTTLSFLSA
jgi:hypothetical protein